uniref:Metabotropic glutamate receptor n=1 Tax=Lygus hesperus TaxID=30085 RepID=A0A0A9X497_LYGHE
MSVTINLSASVTVVCLLSPKLYIILVKPERNVRQSMMSTRKSALKSGVASVMVGTLPIAQGLVTSESLLRMQQGVGMPELKPVQLPKTLSKTTQTSPKHNRESSKKKKEQLQQHNNCNAT